MPRNSGGTYSLPAGNPVVTGTTISSTWANTTLSDIGTALTDSLSRSGQGGMTASLQLASGAIGAPGLSWSAETTSGLYRSAAGDHRYSISAADVAQITTNGLRTVNGAVGTPAFSFIGDPDTGMYLGATNDLRFTTGGNLTLQLDSGNSRIVPYYRIQGQDGSVALPAYSFISDTDTGFYRITADNVGATSGGTYRWGWSNTVFNVRLVTQGPDGAAGSPTYSFENDTDTGMYRHASDTLGFSVGGSAVFRVYTGQIYATVPFAPDNGSAGAPIYTFDLDRDTGFYRDTSNQIGISLGGVTAGQIAQGSFTATLTGFTAAPTPTFTWQRIGNKVIMRIPQFSSTSNGTGFTCTNLPAIIQPSTATYCWIGSGQDNSTQSNTISAQIIGGTMTFQIGNGGLWTAANSKGLGITGFAPSVTLTWMV